MKSTSKIIGVIAATFLAPSFIAANDIVVDKTITRALSGKIIMQNCNTKPTFKIYGKPINPVMLYLVKTDYGYKYRVRYVAEQDWVKISPVVDKSACKGKRRWSPKTRTVNLKFNIINFHNIDFTYKSTSQTNLIFPVVMTTKKLTMTGVASKKVITPKKQNRTIMHRTK